MSWERPSPPPQLPLRWLVAILARLPWKASAPSPLEVRSWLVSANSVWAVPGSPAEACCTLLELAHSATTTATTITRAIRNRPVVSGYRVRVISGLVPAARVNGSLVGRGRASRARRGSAGPGRRGWWGYWGGG